MVGAVESEVDEGRRRSKHAGQPGSAHHAVSGAVSFEQGERVVIEPARMAELDGDVEPRRQRGEEVLEAGNVARVAGRQLHQEGRSPCAQLVQ